MTTEATPGALGSNEGLGPLLPERAAFADVCAMLPEGVSWGDPLTPQIARVIVEAAVAAARERIVRRLHEIATYECGCTEDANLTRENADQIEREGGPNVAIEPAPHADGNEAR